MRVETVEEFKRRGGAVTTCPSGTSGVQGRFISHAKRWRANAECEGYWQRAVVGSRGSQCKECQKWIRPTTQAWRLMHKGGKTTLWTTCGDECKGKMDKVRGQVEVVKFDYK